MKKILSLILCGVLFSLTAFSPFFAYSLTQTVDIEKTQILSSDTYYSFNSADKTLIISGVGAVPDFSNSTSTANSQPWFSWRSDGSIEKVVVEEGITSLGTYCLYNVSTAVISLPSTLKSLGAYSMSGTSANTSVVLPDGFERLSTKCFYMCYGLTEVIIPKSVTAIGASAFESCANLNSVVFKNLNMSLSIERRAFFKCPALNNVTVPKRAAVLDYALGFYSASSGSVYSDFKMSVYRDSPAYTYAVNKAVPYELLNFIEISEGETIASTYYDDNINDTMTFTFVPVKTAKYSFASEGDTDVKCELTDFSGNVISSADDNSVMDLNFSISNDFTAGQTYYFNVKSNNAQGSFSASLLPVTIESVSIDCDTVTLFANETANGFFNPKASLEGKTVNVVFDTGYKDSFVYSDGMTYRDYAVLYSDNQSGQKWLCGNHNCIISVGEASATVDVAVEHSYQSKVVAPNYYEKGYTVHTCVLCKEAYYSDYVNSLGVKVTGKVVLMQSPDGSHKDNIPIALVDIYSGEDNVATVNDDGTFTAFVDSGVSKILLKEKYALTREVAITPDSDNCVNLGNVALFHFDYTGDGYVNAKDFSLIRRFYGKYANVQKDLFISRDYNQDGYLSDDDWFTVGADSFYNCGKITQEIY